jgi:hypothetical protein
VNLKYGREQLRDMLYLAIAHVPDEWKLLRQNLTSFGEKNTWYLKEQGVYFYLARSNKPAA